MLIENMFLLVNFSFLESLSGYQSKNVRLMRKNSTLLSGFRWNMFVDSNSFATHSVCPENWNWKRYVLVPAIALLGREIKAKASCPPGFFCAWGPELVVGLQWHSAVLKADLCLPSFALWSKIWYNFAHMQQCTRTLLYMHSVIPGLNYKRLGYS